MKKLSATVCTLTVTALLASSLAFAEGHGRPDNQQQDEYQNGSRHGQRDDRRGEYRDERNFDQREGRWNQRRQEYNAHGPEFARGRYIPREYRDRAYEVDYREHHLSPPPQGHRWVQVGADYVLIAIATGVIANIILNH